MARVAIAELGGGQDPVLEIVLSVRNAAALMAKALTPGSARALVADAPAGFTAAIIRVESDEVHYAHPSRRGVPAGDLDPTTTALIERVTQVVQAALGEPTEDRTR